MSEEEKKSDVDIETLKKVEEVKKQIWYGIFDQLSQSKRFIKFIDDNYSIVEERDEETKTIEIKVIEKPVAVGPALTSSQLVRLGKIMSTAGCKDVSGTMNKLLVALGQDEEASGLDLSNDVNKALKQTKL